MSIPVTSTTPAPGHWPITLRQAVATPAVYACGVTGIGPILFLQAEYLSAEWVRLHTGHWGNQRDNPSLPYPCPHGVDVRVCDIFWLARAPYDT